MQLVGLATWLFEFIVFIWFVFMDFDWNHWWNLDFAFQEYKLVWRFYLPLLFQTCLDRLDLQIEIEVAVLSEEYSLSEYVKGRFLQLIELLLLLLLVPVDSGNNGYEYGWIRGEQDENGVAGRDLLGYDWYSFDEESQRFREQDASEKARRMNFHFDLIELHLELRESHIRFDFLHD